MLIGTGHFNTAAGGISVSVGVGVSVNVSVTVKARLNVTFVPVITPHCLHSLGSLGLLLGFKVRFGLVVVLVLALELWLALAWCQA